MKWDIQLRVCGQTIYVCNGERIIKIGQKRKLCSNEKGSSFSLTAYITFTAHIMFEVNYNGQTSYVSYYFYCGVPSEVRLYNAKRDLLAIAKFRLNCDVIVL